MKRLQQKEQQQRQKEQQKEQQDVAACLRANCVPHNEMNVACHCRSSFRFGSVGLTFPFCVSPQTDALRGRSGGIGGRREVWVLGQ